MLNKKLDFGIMKVYKKWFIISEFFIQVILFGRLIFMMPLFIDDNTLMFRILFAIYLLISEIIPLLYLVYSVIQRLKVYK